MSVRVYERKFDWDEARTLKAEGWTYKALAARYGVSESGVYRVVKPGARKRVNDRGAAWLGAGTCEECGGRCTRKTRHHQWRGREVCVRCAGRIYNRTRFRLNPDTGLREIRCATCKQWKGTNEFASDKNRSDGFHQQCRPCNTEARQAVRESNQLPCEVCGEKKVCPDGRRQTAYTVCSGCYNALRKLYRTNVMADLIARWRSEQRAAA